MKIAITSSGKSKHSLSDLRFGRCAYFAIYDAQKDTYEFIENDAIHSSHGAGISAAQKIQDLGIGIVLTGRLGPKAKKVLDAGSVKGYEIQEMEIDEAIKAYKDGLLHEIKEAGA
ncbi:NifB/NifX family molybdenum-iron cluster-binding protein [Fusibacter sp. JL216-2]|uniref:NifB/NifX family molybdenum-iron cluster-binding protein n=1 Tax=Fusibacter sp. JL216-2 TaxID=3071453 RepID=UPI003D32CC10